MIHFSDTERELGAQALSTIGTSIDYIQPWAPAIAGALVVVTLALFALEVSRGGRAWPGLQRFLLTAVVWAVVAPRPGADSKQRTSRLISGAVEVTNSIAQWPLKELDAALGTGFYNANTILPFRRLAEEEAASRLDSATEEAIRAFFRPECMGESVVSVLRYQSWGLAVPALSNLYTRQKTDMKECKPLYEAAKAKQVAWQANRPKDAVYQAVRFSLFKAAAERDPADSTAPAAAAQVTPPDPEICEFCLLVTNRESWGAVVGFLTAVLIYAAPFSLLLAIPEGGVWNLAFYFRALLLVQFSAWFYYVLHLSDVVAQKLAPVPDPESDLLYIFQTSVLYGNPAHAKYTAAHNTALYVETGLTIILATALVGAIAWQVVLPVVGLFRGRTT